MRRGISPKAEAMLRQLATKASAAEGRLPSEIFGEVASQISLTLARFGARSSIRRSATPVAPQMDAVRRHLWNACHRACSSADDADPETDADSSSSSDSSSSTSSSSAPEMDED